jgi:Flp pilus assembly protein TadG
MAGISFARGRGSDGRDHVDPGTIQRGAVEVDVIHRDVIDRGVAMVELALILPVLILLLVGIIDFGRAFNWQVSIQGAAREGARALALGESSGDVETAVNGSAGAATVTAIDQSPCPSGSSSSSTSYATVTVHADFTFGIPFVDLGTKTLSASASMRCGL